MVGGICYTDWYGGGFTAHGGGRSREQFFYQFVHFFLVFADQVMIHCISLLIPPDKAPLATPSPPGHFQTAGGLRLIRSYPCGIL
jgi:hypothetical protein